MEFKDILRIKREEFGLSQAELAEKINVSRQTIIKWEKGENYPDMVNLVGLSKLFDVSIDQLVGHAVQAIGVDDKEEVAAANSNETKYNFLLVLAVLSLIIPCGLGLILAIYVQRVSKGDERKITKLICNVSIVINAARISLYVLSLLLW